MPILGYDTAGGSTTGNNTYVYGNIDVTDEIGGKIQNFHCAIDQLDGSLKNIKIAVANVSMPFRNPSSQNVVEQVEYEVAISDDNEIAAPFGESLSADTDYYIAIIPEGAGTKYKYDSGFLVSWYKSPALYVDQFPSPLQSGFVKHGPSYAWSVWIDYQHPGVLGYDVAGGSNAGFWSYKPGTIARTDNIGGLIQTFHCAIASIQGGSEGVKLAVYNVDQSTHKPDTKTLIEQVEFDVVVSDDESITGAGSGLAASTYYWVGCMTEANLTKIKFDDNPGDEAFYQSPAVYANEFVSPWGASSDGSWDISLSVWVDYEEAEEEEIALPILSGDAIHSAEDLIVR